MGIEFENMTELIIDGHVTDGDYHSLYEEGTNERLIVSNFLYSNCVSGMTLGSPNTVMTDAVISNGVINGYTNRGIAAGSGLNRLSVSNVIFRGAGQYQAAIASANGADVSNCQIIGYAGLQGSKFNVSNTSIDCNYTCLDVLTSTLRGCTINRRYRTAYRCNDILFDGCTYTGGHFDQDSPNIQHINCMGEV